MTKLGMISTAAIMVLTIAQAEAMPVVPAQHARAVEIVQSVDFLSCYSDTFMRGQRAYTSRLGGFLGGLAWTATTALGGAFTSFVVAGACAH